MAKYCPKENRKVIYLYCMECEDKKCKTLDTRIRSHAPDQTLQDYNSRIVKYEEKNMTFKNEFYEYIKNMPNLPGSYNVGITNTKTDETHETQGDIPDEDYTWDDFYEWLVQDIKEMGLDIEDITLDYIEYAGELDID